MLQTGGWRETPSVSIRDEAAIEAAGKRLTEFGDKLTIIRNNYSQCQRVTGTDRSRQGRRYFS